MKSRWRAFVLLIFGTLVGSLTQGDEWAGVVSEFPGGALFGKSESLTVTRELRLTEDSVIRLDELRLAAPLITQGHRLQIDVRKLVFEGEGRIVAFDGPQAANAAAGLSGAAGKPGADHDSEKEQGKELDGGPGAPGEPGLEGAEGYPGMKTPGEILVFAATLEGKPRIDGIGQKGGPGGRGGQGGKGGRGGNGSKAYAATIGKDHPAGKGGPGGPGGSGGKGGRGGQGGGAVPVRFLVGTLGADHSGLTDVISGPGLPGEGGEPGARGEAGGGGRGGNEDSGFLGMAHEDQGGVNTAYPFAIPAENLGKGDAGAKSPDDSSPAKLTNLGFQDLEAFRLKLHQAWYEFHLSRSLDFLIRDSVRLALHLEKSRTELAALFEGEEAILLELDAQYRATVISAWTEQFIVPLEKASDDHPLSKVKRDDALEVGRQVVALLGTHAPSIEQIRSLLKQSDLKLQESLDQALVECRKYNAAKSDRLSDFLGATAYYQCPACEMRRGFLSPEHLNDPIVLTRRVSRSVSPSLQLSSLLALPRAYAGEFTFSYFREQADPVRIKELSAPSAERIVESAGVPMGYRAPPESAVNLTTLGEVLLSLALQLGASG